LKGLGEPAHLAPISMYRYRQRLHLAWCVSLLLVSCVDMPQIRAHVAVPRPGGADVHHHHRGLPVGGAAASGPGTRSPISGSPLIHNGHQLMALNLDTPGEMQGGFGGMGHHHLFQRCHSMIVCAGMYRYSYEGLALPLTLSLHWLRVQALVASALLMIVIVRGICGTV
jgi:hypothetical protein